MLLSELVFPLILLLLSSPPVALSLKIAAQGRTTPHTPTPHPTSLSDSDNLPKITLLNSSSVYGGEPVYSEGGSTLLFQNETVYVIPSTRTSLMFQCEAKYPVFWNLLHSTVHPSVYNALRVLSIREFQDPFDPTTFTYRTILTMNGPSTKLTGNYSCQSSARNEIQSNIYVYWESSFGNAFVHSKENITLTLSPYSDSNGAEVVTLPCQVTDPDAKPKLTKDTGVVHQPFEDISGNDSVHYSPSVGYTLKNFGNPGGIYKCELDGNDFVSIHVVQKNESEISVKKGNDGDTPEKRYTFQYDETAKLVKCCSGGGKKPPKIYMIPCEHPSTCALRGYQGMEWGRYMWNQGRRRGNCTVLSLKSFLHTGIVWCVGNGFNVYKELIVPLRSSQDLGWSPIAQQHEQNMTMYFRWEEIDPQEMIRIRDTRQHYYDPIGHPSDDSLDGRIYSEEDVHLLCDTSRYYFASGAYWMIRWNNQTITPLFEGDTERRMQNSMADYRYYDRMTMHSNEVYFVASTGMESILCMAPVWNSSLWVTKIHFLYVNETIPPTIKDSKEIVEYTWYTNETNKELNCDASGFPTPTFTWKKDNMTILISAHNYNMFHSNASKDNTSSSPSSPTTTEPDSLDDGGGGGSGDDDDQQLNQNIGNYSETRNETASGKRLTASSTLRISRVSYSTHGVFHCVASNFGGKTVKEFHVTVIERKSWKATGVLVAASIATVFLIIGIIYLLKKLHRDRQEINQLTRGSVNFADVMRRSVTSSNSSFAPATTASGVGAGRGPGMVSTSSTSSSTTTPGALDAQHNSSFSSTPFDNGRMTNLLIDTY